MEKLEEYNVASKVDVTAKHDFPSKPAKLKIGGAFAYKERDFIVDSYSLRLQPQELADTFNGDADQILASNNIINPATGIGTYASLISAPSDSYNSSMNIAAAYASEEFKINNRITSVVGLRAEMFQLRYTGSNQRGLVFNNALILDKFDLFPSANVIFDLDEDASQKIRTAYYRTTARPSFKEASAVEIIDPISNNIGNINIQPTYVNNFDLRYERYAKEGNDFMAVSAFYKSFKDPIEITFFISATGQLTPVNLGDAEVFGAEFEVRKDLSFINGLDDWYVNANVSLIESQQQYSAPEREARRLNLRTGETLSDTRQLQGQSPYIVNVGIGYKGQDNGWDAGLFYNVQGRTLEVVSSGNIPDVFTEPFNNLKLNFGKSFGTDKKQKLTLSFSNILNEKIESYYRPNGGEERLFSSRYPGQAISMGYSFKF